MECFYCHNEIDIDDKIWAVWTMFEDYSCNSCFIENIPKAN